MKEETDSTITAFSQSADDSQLDEQIREETFYTRIEQNYGNKNEKTPTPAPVGFFKLFRFAKGKEVFILMLGFLLSLCTAICMPLSVLFFGKFASTFIVYDSQLNAMQCKVNVSENHYNDSIIKDTTQMTVLSHLKNRFHEQMLMNVIGVIVVIAVEVISGYGMVACMNWAAERQCFQIRSLFFKAMLRQDITWYDTNNSGCFASKIADDLRKLQTGIGEKMAMCCYTLAIPVFSIITAMIFGWELTLVSISMIPITMMAKVALGNVQNSLARKESEAKAKAAEVPQEALQAVKTVCAFGGEEKEVGRYEEYLKVSTAIGIKLGITTALMNALINLYIYTCHALTYWYGIKLIVDEANKEFPTYTAYNFIIVRINVSMAFMHLQKSVLFIEVVAQTKASAAIIFEVIDRVPLIDSSSPEGQKPETVDGNIEFENVIFNYPSRPDVNIFDSLSLKVQSGETVALVGESGSGKSTIIQLIQRFYDTVNGFVKIDRCDVRLLNIGWLRNQIGIVGQEPMLFATTIAKNIGYGLEGATQGDIENAAQMANAHDFIMQLPQKYETIVGDRGIQLSGGQKQRVAIARALVKNPKILLLDEATSALDSESEAIVLAALDKARLGRTTLIVAHRLSTIRNADKIATIQGGQLVEIGTHDELMANGGIYHKLVTTQQLLIDNNDQPTAEQNFVVSKQETYPSFELNPLLDMNIPDHCDLVVSNGVEQLENDLDELKPSFLKVLKYNREEWPVILLGCIGTVGICVVTSTYALIFGYVLGILADCNPEHMMEQGIFYVYLLLGLAVLAIVSSFLQVFGFSYASQFLAKRLRNLSFAAMLKQEMEWFDEPKNSAGDLCSRLSSDAAQVQMATGSAFGIFGQSLIMIVSSVVISFALSWHLALVGFIIVPVLLLFTFIINKTTTKQAMLEMETLDSANSMAIDCISNIRTVASLHMEMRFHDMYLNHLTGPHKVALRNIHSRGIVIGLTRPAVIFAYTAITFYGSFLVSEGSVECPTIYKITELLSLISVVVGQALTFAPDYIKGLLAAARIFLLLDRKSLIDSTLKNGLKLADNTPGKLQFKKVGFEYPSRPNVVVLKDVDLEIEPGSMVALVGVSGCGKTTCVQLVERFYNPTHGSITVDGIDISELNIAWLRSRIGIVSQEPILFDCSIADNIRYGDNSREVRMDEVIHAAQTANIHNFINALPQGYETPTGDKGAKLSGGQKQRIAIARALVRNPSILLLDEATSSLDTESEKVVQEALECAQRGRTCITVAHRLTTIKDANQIAVFHQGKIVELGTHDDLMAHCGNYQRLYKSAP